MQNKTVCIQLNLNKLEIIIFNFNNSVTATILCLQTIQTVRNTFLMQSEAESRPSCSLRCIYYHRIASEIIFKLFFVNVFIYFFQW